MLALVRDIATTKAITLILSSHLLPDVEFACDHVVVLHKGAVATQGPIKALKGTSGRVFELRVKGDEARFAEALRAEGSNATVTSAKWCASSCRSISRRSCCFSWPRAMACRCGICVRACRRSRTCSPARWARRP